MTISHIVLQHNSSLTAIILVISRVVAIREEGERRVKLKRCEALILIISRRVVIRDTRGNQMSINLPTSSHLVLQYNSSLTAVILAHFIKLKWRKAVPVRRNIGGPERPSDSRASTSCALVDVLFLEPPPAVHRRMPMWWEYACRRRKFYLRNFQGRARQYRGSLWIRYAESTSHYLTTSSIDSFLRYEYPWGRSLVLI